MITQAKLKELESYDKYLVYGFRTSEEVGDWGIIGVKKDTPKDVIKKIKKFLKEMDDTPKLQNPDDVPESISTL